MSQSPPDPRRRHPDPKIESILQNIALDVQRVARNGAAEHIRERVEQAILTGERLGPYNPSGAGSDRPGETADGSTADVLVFPGRRRTHR